MNKIYQGNALDVLKTFPDESIDMAITSPPYWALRDYGVEGQLGLEPTFQEYINKLCDIFDEVKRVLKKTGTCWVNMGDTYGSHIGYDSKQTKDNKKIERRERVSGFEKCLLQIPSRFAIEMTDRGWILRNEIIWHKPNCMPSSVKDRFTVDFEKIFFFTKNKKYWFEMQYEPHTSLISETNNKKLGKDVKWSKPLIKNQQAQVRKNHDIHYDGTGYGKDGRNKRAVWKITTKPYKEAHFAVYPEKLIETPIKAGCPEFICKKCGFLREKIYKKGRLKAIRERDKQFAEKTKDKDLRGIKDKGWNLEDGFSPGLYYEKIYKGLTSCKCNTGFEGGIVLDIFMGSGTTAVVARSLKRNYIGIELKAEYIKLTEKRLRQNIMI